MSRNFTIVLTASAIITVGSASAQSIEVRLFNFARVEAGALDEARATADKVLQAAGVQAKWIDCSRPPAVEGCQGEPGPATLVVQLLPGGPVWRKIPPSAFGFVSPPEAGQFGAYAVILHDRAARLRSSALSWPRILGHAIAHELGHLLLDTTGHSVGGIMKTEWSNEDFVQAAQGVFGFLEREHGRIRKNVATRIRAANASESAENFGRPE